MTIETIIIIFLSGALILALLENADLKKKVKYLTNFSKWLADYQSKCYAANNFFPDDMPETMRQAIKEAYGTK